MKKLFIFVILLALSACAAPAAPSAVTDGGLEFYNPRAIAASEGEVSGIFMSIKNIASTPDRLLSATSDTAELVEVHETTMSNGIMSMHKVDFIDLPAGETVKLEHGGYHIMLINLTRALVAGETVKITLVFEQAGSVTISIPVVAR